MINVTTTAERNASDRTQVYLAVTGLLINGLPAPIGIHSDNGFDHVSVQFATTDDFDAWAAHLNLNVHWREKRHGDTVQCHGSGDWMGGRIYIRTCIRVEESETPEAPSVELSATDLEQVPQQYPAERRELILATLNHLEAVHEDDAYIAKLPELAAKTVERGHGGGVRFFELLDGTAYEWNEYTYERWTMRTPSEVTA